MSNANGKPHNSDYLLICDVDFDVDLTIWPKSTCRKADVDGWIWKDGFGWMDMDGWIWMDGYGWMNMDGWI